MREMKGIRRLFRLTGIRGSVEGEVEDELTFHLDSRIEELVASGVDRETAERQARQEFGDLAAARSELSEIDRRRVRRERRRGAFEDLRQDSRVAWRSLLRRPSYMVVAVLTLALGLGAASTIYAVVDAVLLRRLPFPEPDRLAIVWGVAGPERDIRGASYAEVGDWRERARSFTTLSLYSETGFTLSGDGTAEILQAETVSPGYLEMLGAQPLVGRFLQAEDDRPGITPPVVISYDLWQDRFEGSPDILGRTLVLDGRQAVIVGVAAAGFHGLSFDTDVWATLPPFNPDGIDDRGSRYLAAVGRMAPGVTRESAQGELESITERMEAEMPATNTERRADLFSLHQYFLDSSRTVMLALLGAVGLLLLIACVNVLNLQLVRGLARDQEVAVRYSLGARRGRVVRQLLTESMVLAGLGGLAGLLLAVWGTRSLVTLVPPGVIPAYADVGIDMRVLGVMVALIAVVGLLSGALPALRSSKRGLAGALRSADRSGSEGASRRAFGIQHALVAVEVGLAVALMLAATVMIRSLRAQLRVDPGFDPENVLAARLYLPGEQYPDAASRRMFADRVLDALRSLPGIESAAIGSDAPLRGNTAAAILRVPDARGDEGIRFYRHMVTPGFFETARMPVIQGRAFESTDTDGNPPVAIVSRAFADKLWPGQDPVGRQIGVLGTMVEVVGVIGDTRYRDLVTSLMDPGEDPDVWFSYDQIPTGTFDIVMRYGTNAAVDLGAVQQAIAGIDPDIPLFQVGYLQDGLNRQTANDRFGAVLLGLFGVAALALAAIGLFGVMSFVVSMRRREIAIRIALGSAPGAVLGRLLRQGLMVVAAGGAGGLLVAWAGGSLISGMLFGVQPLDPLSIAVVLSVLGVAAVLANAIPATRAAGTDPQVVLRGD